MQLRGSIALVTGANRGIGKAFVEGLLAAGARKIYAGARNPADVTSRGVTPVKLDITNIDQVALATEQCADINVLINNAGIGAATPLIASPELRDVKAMMDTNYFGTLNMCRAFAPVLKRNGGGASGQYAVGCELEHGRLHRWIFRIQDGRARAHPRSAHRATVTRNARGRCLRRIHGHRHDEELGSSQGQT